MHLDQLLPGLMAWLNQSRPIDAKKPLTTADVAHMALTSAEFAQVPTPAEWCAWRRVNRKWYLGLEFWESRYALPAVTSHADLSRRIAWKITANTVALFKEKTARESAV